MYGNERHVCTIWEEPKCSVAPTAGFFSKKICAFRRIMLPCEWHFGSTIFIRSLKRLRLERSRQTHAYIWHPYSPIKYYWDCVQLFLIFSALLYMPIQVFLSCPNQYDAFILFTDAVAFISMFTKFHTGYVESEHKNIILEPRSIAKHYLKTYFITDFIGALPLQIFTSSKDCRYPTHTAMFMFKLLRTLSMSRQWKNVIGQFQLSYVNYVALKVMTMLIMFFHWMTYIHFQVPLICYHFYEHNESFDMWLKRFNISKDTGVGNEAIFQKYSSNFYLVCGLCIGAGYYMPLDTHLIPELLLSSCMGLIGLLFLTYAFAVLMRLAVYRQFELYCFSGKYKELKEYMSLMGLPKYLQRKINLFINYKFNDHFFHEHMIKNTINEQIQQDINMYCCKKLVMNVPMFQDMPVALINSIIFSLTQVLYMPGQIIITFNEPGYCIHLIASGTVAVMDATGREMAHLRDGAYFGEYALLSPGVLRTATIVALEITEIYTLDSNQFLACLQPYPHLKRRMEEISAKRRGNNTKSTRRH